MITSLRQWLAEPRRKAVIREYAESLLVAFVLAMIIRTFIVQAFKIPTGSMIPTLQVGDRILVTKFPYWFREPQRGEIVVFKYPEDPKVAFIKRLVALANEQVEIKDGRIFINGIPAEEPRLQGRFYFNQGDFGAPASPVPVPPESLYVLGDNSANSKDSRYWGFVPRRNLIGHAVAIYWPPQRMRILH